jgi:two-component system, chemotaxis family, chemotaxis protein CheY
VNSDIEFESSAWRLLLAEDSKVDAEIIASHIRSYPIPIEITRVSTGEEGLALLSSNQFDLAFFDVVFSGLSGIDALRNVREAGFRTFVTLMSGSRPNDYRRIGRELFAYDYLQKPLTRELIHAVLDSYGETRIRKKILVIDDSATARRLMKRIMERSLFVVEIIEANDGIAGFEAFMRHRPDAVFVDLHMTLLDGESTVRILRAANAFVPIVLVTGDVKALTGTKATYKLAKPFTPYQISDLLYNFCSRRAPLSDAAQ